jgi:hypothetical protein
LANADFYLALNLEKNYGSLKVKGAESVGSKTAYVLVGQLGGAPVRLYFDQSSGLLLRRFTVVPTVAGDSPFQEDFDDYRDAGHGVKYPYTIRMEPAGPRTELVTHSTLQVERIEENISIDREEFNRPESGPDTKGR